MRLALRGSYVESPPLDIENIQRQEPKPPIQLVRQDKPKRSHRVTVSEGLTRGIPWDGHTLAGKQRDAREARGSKEIKHAGQAHRLGH